MDGKVSRLKKKSISSRFLKPSSLKKSGRYSPSLEEAKAKLVDTVKAEEEDQDIDRFKAETDSIGNVFISEQDNKIPTLSVEIPDTDPNVGNMGDFLAPSIPRANRNNNEDTKKAPKETHIQVCIRMRPLLAVPTMSSSISKIPAPTTKNVQNNGIKSSRFLKATASSSLRNKLSNTNSLQENKPVADYAWNISRTTSDEDPDIIEQAEWTNPDPSRKSKYFFDKVYGPSINTSEIYASSIRPIVRAAVEGYHGSVFAYGQTSTGKTHTMQGTKKELGVVPLAVEDTFRFITKANEDAEQSNREYLLRVSYMEIYNEQIHDLLTTSVSTKNSIPNNRISMPSAQVRIFENKKDGVVIRGLKEEIVNTPQQVYALIEAGEANRHTGSTSLNKHSSRSHSIFRIVIESRMKHISSTNTNSNASASSAGSDLNKPIRVSSLSLVDLAGSESIKIAGTQGQRLKEGQYINKSLMTLGHVIFKLSEQADATEHMKNKTASMYQHIPYRDSKLTRILQTSLSGNAQICVVCNVSPSATNVEETHNTLKFAARAKRIKQTATINEVNDDRTLLQNYKEEIESLKKQLKEARSSQNKGKKVEDMNVDEDATALVKAIKNLETLILTKNTNIKIPSAIDKDIDDDEELLSADSKQFSNDFKKALSLTNAQNGKYSIFQRKEKKSSGLVQELHRIQNLLGSVLSKSQTSSFRKKGKAKGVESFVSPLLHNESKDDSSDTSNSDEHIDDPNISLFTQNRDQEMESLRRQLKNQEAVTSLKNADSSFLENQLAEKER